jgi:hypothetical protein
MSAVQHVLGVPELLEEVSYERSIDIFIPSHPLKEPRKYHVDRYW